MTSEVVAIFPRIHILEKDGRSDSFEIGRFRFRKDLDEVWQQEFSRNRPSWLNIYREFSEPDEHGNFEAPSPSHGTLIVGEKSWLNKYSERLIGVLHFLSGPSDFCSPPSEAYHYHLLNPFAKPTEDVSIPGKTALYIESAQSLQLLPPLELRGVLRRIALDRKSERVQLLFDKLDADPEDRLLLACYHLFRASFGNSLQAPFSNDVAAMCACLEAALGIPEVDCGKELVKALCKKYPNLPNFESWCRGLYGERSLFNHGALPDKQDPRHKDWEFFRENRARSLTVLRSICIDIINDHLHAQSQPDDSSGLISEWVSKQWNVEYHKIQEHFLSDVLWRKIRNIFENQASWNESNDEHSPQELLALLLNFERTHSWQAVSSLPKPGHVFDTLRTMAAVSGLAAKQKGFEQIAELSNSLYQSAVARDSEAILDWFLVARKHEKGVIGEQLCEAVFLAAIHTAEFFANTRRT